MELYQIAPTKVTYLTNVRRHGQLFMPLAAHALVERYHFQAPPSSLAEMQQTPIAFRHGLFQDIAIEEFLIYGDGVVASSASNTDVIDAFIDDIFGWMNSTLSLTEIGALKRGKIYESSLTVALDIDPQRLVPWARPAERFLTDKWKSYGDLPAFSFQPGQVRLGVDQSNNTAISAPWFSIERRGGISWDKNVFYSVAPLRTDDHLHLLTEIEKSLAR